LKDAKRFSSNIEDVAVKKHFNRLTINGEHIYELENSLAHTEGEISNSFSEIRNSRKLTRESLTAAISLISLFACRTPAIRKILESFKENVQEHLFHALATQDELWEGRDDGLTQEMYLETYGKGEIKPVISDKTSLIKDELTMVKHLAPLLLKIKWTLLDSAHCGESFIISDRAVALFHKDKRKGPAGSVWGGVGFGVPDTVVHFPISSELALYGVLEDEEKLDVNVDLVASFNGHVIGCADRFIYFNNNGFLASDYTGKKHDESSVLEYHHQN